MKRWMLISVTVLTHAGTNIMQIYVLIYTECVLNPLYYPRGPYGSHIRFRNF